MGRPPRGPSSSRRRTQGAPPNDKDFRRRRADEPDDHAIGRSRGGLTTKTHALVDGRGLPLVIALTPGQAGDSTALRQLLAELRVPRLGPGRPRSKPQALRGDKAYSARAHRAHLRSRGIAAVIPEPSDQIGHRKNKGSRGGRPVAFDAADYKNRNVVERAFNHLKNWRGLATRYDKHALVYRGGVVLASILLWLS
jgi:transposase